MAFTATQKLNIRHALGYTQLYVGVDTRLENAIDNIGADPEAVILVTTLLAQFEAAWADFVASSASAGIRTIDKDDVGFFDGNAVMVGKANVGRSVVNRLSIVMGIPICADVFGRKGIGSPAYTYNHGDTYLQGLG